MKTGGRAAPPVVGGPESGDRVMSYGPRLTDRPELSLFANPKVERNTWHVSLELTPMLLQAIRAGAARRVVIKGIEMHTHL